MFQIEKVCERQNTAHRSVLPISPVFCTIAKRPRRQIKLRASAAAPTPWFRGGEKGDPSSRTQPLQLQDPSGCGKRAHQPLMVAAEGRMKSCKPGVAEPCIHCQGRDATCMSRDGCPTETKDVGLANLLWFFSVAVCPWATGWFSPYFGFPMHEARAMLLFHRRGNACDRDGGVGIICWKCPLIPTDPGDARMTLLLAVRS